MSHTPDYRQDHWSPELRSIGFNLGKYIYLLDAYDDLARDERKGAYNPLRTLSRDPGYEEEMREIFELLLANCARSFERLPCVEDAKTIEMGILILTEYHLFHMIALIKFNIMSGHFGSRCESGTVSQQP